MQPTLPDYSTFSTDDFLNDRHFIRAVRDQDPAARAFWVEWQQRQPLNLGDYQKAVALLDAILRITPLRPAAQYGHQLLLDINAGIGIAERQQRRRRLFGRAGIGLLTSVLVGTGIFWYSQSLITVHTGFAQRKQVILPDQSTITLNANSTLRYRRSWRWQPGREVWLQGEAFLSVKHLNQDSTRIKPAERFRLHTDQVDIDVLGTQLNVRNRRQVTTVALITGKVSVRPVHASPQLAMSMKPGEIVSYQRGKLTRQLAQQARSVPDAWLNGTMMVKGMTARQIIDTIEDTYGYHIVLDTPKLDTTTIDGTFPLANPEATLYMLANILNANLQRQDRTIYLRAR